ncbi:hypothetical protein N9B10_04005 [Pirellulales bacterium]|jgi:hypothetical protein|nr:hypothetical protein [Pirellulales bacterium]
MFPLSIILDGPVVLFPTKKLVHEKHPAAVYQKAIRDAFLDAGVVRTGEIVHVDVTCYGKTNSSVRTAQTIRAAITGVVVREGWQITSVGYRFVKSRHSRIEVEVSPVPVRQAEFSFS